jgi:hypothetical protein
MKWLTARLNSQSDDRAGDRWIKIQVPGHLHPLVARAAGTLRGTQGARLGGLDMAARTFFVSVQNFTGKVWDRVDVGLSHGAWSENGIPSEHWLKVSLDDDGNVVPGEDWFMSESDGFATGTEGFVDYTAQGVAGTLHIHWNNPFVGGNEFTAAGPNQFHYFWGDPGGTDANINLVIQKRP